MSLDDTTQKILALQAGAREQTYQAAQLILRVHDDKEYKEAKLRSFSAYVKGKLEPKMDRKWAYDLMSLAEAFTEPDFVENGPRLLLEVIHLQKVAFPALEPGDLLSGSHAFKGADGLTRQLDWATDHSEKTLKALVAAARAKPTPTGTVLKTPEGQRLDLALSTEVAAGDALHYAIAEQSDGASPCIEVKLTIPLHHVQVLLKNIAEDY